MVQGFFFYLMNYKAILPLSFLPNIFIASFGWRESPAEPVQMWFQSLCNIGGRKLYIRFDWQMVIVCAAVMEKKKSCQKHFYFYLIRVITKSQRVNAHNLVPYHLTLKWQTQNTICYTLLELDSVICVRRGIGSAGQIVTSSQMRSVYLWNCSQSCKTDLLNADELEPIQCDTLKITLVQI